MQTTGTGRALPEGVIVTPITDREQWLELRRRDVTASVIAALLGVHPYVSGYGLWAEKKGLLPPTEDNPAMERGRLLEPVAIELLRRDRPGWIVEAPGAYYSLPALRIGATPDTLVHCPERGAGTVQIKTTVDLVFRKDWRDPDTGETVPPAWIAIQALTEAYLTGSKWAAVAVLVMGFGLELSIVDVPIHGRLLDRLFKEVDAFWTMFDSGAKPDPDYGRDANVIAAVYRAPDEAAPPVELVGLDETLARRDALKTTMREAEKELSEIDTRIKAALGNAVKGQAEAWNVSWPLVKSAGYTVGPREYRSLKVTKRK